jgi:hypothetical protein
VPPAEIPLDEVGGGKALVVPRWNREDEEPPLVLLDERLQPIADVDQLRPVWRVVGQITQPAVLVEVAAS